MNLLTPWLFYWAVAFAMLELSGCAHYDDNPRNMQNMTPEQIEKELADL